MKNNCLLLVLALASAPATAGYVVTLEEVGSDVVATGSGPIDLSGLPFLSGSSTGPGIVPNLAAIITGPALSTSIDIYEGITGPSNFGSGVVTAADSGSGDTVAINGATGLLGVPAGYVSGDPLSDTATYLNETFASLGVTPGTYVWSWGSGEHQNFTLVIGEDTAVPAPAPLALLGLGLAGLGWSRRKKK